MVTSSCTAASEEWSPLCICKSTVSASNAINHGKVTVDSAALYHRTDALFQWEHRQASHLPSPPISQYKCLRGDIKVIIFQYSNLPFKNNTISLFSIVGSLLDGILCQGSLIYLLYSFSFMIFWILLLGWAMGVFYHRLVTFACNLGITC